MHEPDAFLLTRKLWSDTTKLEKFVYATPANNLITGLRSSSSVAMT